MFGVHVVCVYVCDVFVYVHACSVFMCVWCACCVLYMCDMFVCACMQCVCIHMCMCMLGRNYHRSREKLESQKVRIVPTSLPKN